MRLNKFESADLEPLGKGDDREVFVNPKNERRVISEGRKDVEKDTPRQLKGRYYLTKIAHLLLPKNIPDVYQVGESHDGTQTVDAERISHTPEQARLQEIRLAGGDEEMVGKQIIEELGRGPLDVTLKLADIGFAFNIDENIGNFTKDETGSVYYLETFKPWQVDPVNSKELEILFNEDDLKEAIECVSDEKTKEKSTQYLERLRALFEEEKKELREQQEASLTECDSHIEELETTLAPFLNEEVLTALNAIKTEKEALNSEKRETAKEILVVVLKKLNFLSNETNITDEEYDNKHRNYKILCRAVGIISRGLVDHDR